MLRVACLLFAWRYRAIFRRAVASLPLFCTATWACDDVRYLY